MDFIYKFLDYYKKPEVPLQKALQVLIGLIILFDSSVRIHFKPANNIQKEILIGGHNIEHQTFENKIEQKMMSTMPFQISYQKILC